MEAASGVLKRAEIMVALKCEACEGPARFTHRKLIERPMIATWLPLLRSTISV
jgi:hypothetical protein